MTTKTETTVTDFKINYLTEAQYQEAAATGEINQNEIYMTPAEQMPTMVLGNYKLI